MAEGALRKSTEAVNSSFETSGSGDGKGAFLFVSEIVFPLHKPFLMMPRLFDAGLKNGSYFTLEKGKFLRNHFCLV